MTLPVHYKMLNCLSEALLTKVIMHKNAGVNESMESKQIMSKGRESVLAVAGLLVMLCELAAGPAQAQYAYHPPIPQLRRSRQLRRP